MRKRNFQDKVFAQQLFVLIILFSIASCTQTTPASVTLTEKKSPVKPPVIIKAGLPFVIKLDTCLPPLSVALTDKDSLWIEVPGKNETTRIRITKPETRPADFFIPMQTYNMEKGLVIDAVLGSFQDHAGNLWFGTHGGGMTRYDGKLSFNLTADEGLGYNSVDDIMEDKEGNIWFSMMGGGIAKFDGRTITPLTRKDGLISDEVRFILVDENGDFIIGTREGLNRYDHKRFFGFQNDPVPGKDILNGVKDKNGDFWFGTLDAGIVRYHEDSFTVYNKDNGLPDNDIASSFVDSKGNIWFGTRKKGLLKFDGKSFTQYYDMPGVPRNTVHSITEDNEGNIWFGIYNGGVSRFDGNSFFTITAKQGLAQNIVKSLIKDKTGNLWFGTYGGASCYTGEAFTVFTTSQGLPDSRVRNIIEDRKGNYWFGTDAGGVCSYDGKQFTSYKRLQGLPHNTVNRVFEDKAGNIWFCTGEGVCRFDGKHFTNFTTAQGLAYGAVRCIVEDKNGIMWFGTEMGLSKFDGKNFYNFTKAQGLPSMNIRDMIEDENGYFWLGTHAGGLVRYDGKNFLVLDTSHGMVDNYINNLTEDSRGNIWVCTGNNGVSILRKQTREAIERNTFQPGDDLFESFTTKEGLSENVPYDAVEDQEGNIFIGTNLGITVVRGGLDPVKPIDRNQLEQYNWKNGYHLKDMFTQSMYVDHNDIVWAGTSDKLVKFDYKAIRKDTNPPEVHIQNLRVNNEYVGWYNLQKKNKESPTPSSIFMEEKASLNHLLNKEERDSIQKRFTGIKFDSIARFYPVPQHLRLPYIFNNVSFEFAAIEIVRPFLVKYQYMLEGYDKVWNPITEKSSASFGNIREGEYVFKVKAMSPEGVWSEPIQYTFTVLPPWYRTWWAYVSYAASLVLILYGLYRNRIKKLVQKQSLQLHTVISTQEEERKRISRDLHDDVGTKLSALKLFLSSLKNNAEKKQYEQVDQLASNSEQLINETIKDVREMLLNLSPGILNEFGYTNAVEVLVNKINQANTIHFHLSVFGIKDKLRNEYELALYRITQELINNVLKHSEAKNVSLQIGYRDEKIIIIIEDDGKGFDLNKHKDGYGLKNLEARTRLLNGNMNIDSQIGKGTSVLIEVPYKFNQ